MLYLFNAYLAANILCEPRQVPRLPHYERHYLPNRARTARKLPATTEEITQFQTILMSDNLMVASRAISFFSNTVSAVTPDILRRIFEIGLSGDPEFAEEATSLIHEAIKTRQVPIGDFLRLHAID